MNPSSCLFCLILSIVQSFRIDEMNQFPVLIRCLFGWQREYMKLYMLIKSLEEFSFFGSVVN